VAHKLSQALLPVFQELHALNQANQANQTSANSPAEGKGKLKANPDAEAPLSMDPDQLGNAARQGPPTQAQLNDPLPPQHQSPAAIDMAPAPVAPAPVFALAAGALMLQRHLGFHLIGAPVDAPRPYQGLVAAAQINAELFPLARSSLRGLSRLGIEGEVALSPQFHSEVPGVAFRFISMYRQWNAHLSYRLASSSFEIRPQAGYGMTSFEMVPPAQLRGLPGLPAGVAFQELRLGARGHLALGRLVSLTAGLFGSYLPSGGEIDSPEMFGPGRGWGLEGSAGIHVQLFSRISADARLQYARYQILFDGTGAQSHTVSDGQNEVKSAIDQYLGAMLLVGFAL
jgi:hypothetical protein